MKYFELYRERTGGIDKTANGFFTYPKRKHMIERGGNMTARERKF